jgi:thiamine pyrophosphate-dependent acetolactate synthase large subunit-like protein
MIADVFKKEGVKYIFGIPGGHIYPMMEACEERGIPFIGVRHEMTAAFMAEGWALTTGTVGVCTGTAGPGFTNLVTGLANSSNGGIPVFCMAGKARVTENGRNQPHT